MGARGTRTPGFGCAFMAHSQLHASAKIVLAEPRDRRFIELSLA